MANSKTNCSINGIKYFKKYTMINGTRKMIYGKSEKDWQKKVDAEKINEALGLIDATSTLGQAIDLWIYVSLASNMSIRLSTFSIHEGVYRNRIKGKPICNRKLRDVKSIDMQNFINDLAKEGRSPHAIQAAMKVFNMFFRFAIQEGYVLKNPCTNAHSPKLPIANEIKVFTDAEIGRIKNALVGDRNRFLFLFVLATGLRQGEALAFRHKELLGNSIIVNKEQSNIRHITKGEKTSYEIVDTEPKTNSSYRTIPLPEIIKTEYLAHRFICQKENLKNGKGKLKENDLIFLSPTGLRWQTGNIQEAWKLVLIKAEVPYKSFHSLRHTYITKLVQSGMNIVTIMQLAGHSKMETTLRYTHIEMEHKELSAEIMNELIK